MIHTKQTQESRRPGFTAPEPVTDQWSSRTVLAQKLTSEGFGCTGNDRWERHHQGIRTVVVVTHDDDWCPSQDAE